MNPSGRTRDVTAPTTTTAEDARPGEGASTPEPGASRAAAITTVGLSKHFNRRGGEKVTAIDDTSFTVHAGEIVVLLGPSGCGKTTLLRCLAGLEQPDGGEIAIGDRTVYSAARRIDVRPERRRMSMLFQSYALWPHMTVFDNVAYPLLARRVPRADVRARVLEALRLVRCDHLEQQHPGSISGGQQQRVALARAIVAGDPVVLFDEPLSNVDQKVREELRFELRELQQRIGFSAVYVTHDQSEALALADRIAVLQDGVIAQIGTPTEIYREPKTPFVARFMGNLNEIPGVVVSRKKGQAVLRTAIGEIVAEVASTADWRDGETLIVGWRPEANLLSARNPGGANTWKVDIRSSVFLGSQSEYVLDIAGESFRARRGHSAEADSARDLDVAGEVWAAIHPRDIILLRDAELADAAVSEPDAER